MIRPAETADLDTIAALRHALWPEEPLDELRTDAEANLARSDGGFATWVAVDGGEVVGFAEVSLRRDYVNGCVGSPVAFLEGIYVLPEHRRGGAGRALVAMAGNGAASAAAASSRPMRCLATSSAAASTAAPGSRKPSGWSTSAS